MAYIVAVFIITLFATPALHAGQVHAAVASNFNAAFDELAARFSQNSGHELLASLGSSGKLYAQIINGAPYQIFLSADIERAQRLEAQGYAVAGSRYTYAIGRLVLWSVRPAYVDAAGVVLKDGAYTHLALANPKIAPYGMAARQVLERFGLWSSLQGKLVIGENIAQTLHFISSGNAPLGFVALAQAQALSGGSWWLVPQELYEPIAQQAVLLQTGADNPAAKQFMDYLRSDEAKTIIRRHGYAVE